MSRRIVIVGGPHTGKTTLSTRLGIESVRHSDDIKHLGWSESSAAASEWFSEQGDWVCEGVQMARALRKWLAANPDKPLDVDIIKLSEPFDLLLQGQQSMAKGIETVFSEIETDLINRGARIHRLAHPNEAIKLFQRQNMPDTDAKPDNTSEGDGKNTEGKDKAADTDKAKNDQDAKQFTQADLDRIAAKTREEEKQKAKAAKEKEDRERAEADAKEQGKFEKLANDRQARIDELEPKVAALEAERDSLKTVLVGIAASELKALPDEVRDISPAVYAEDKSLTNPDVVLAWLPKGKTLAEKLNGSAAAPGAKGDPKPKSGPGDADKDKQARFSARRDYQSL